MIDNERRADLGAGAVWAAATQTNVHRVEDTETAITDTLAYIAHFIRRCGLVVEDVFEAGIRSFEGDYEDGPGAEPCLDPTLPLAEYATGIAASRIANDPDWNRKQIDRIIGDGACARCGSPLAAGLCTDITCPFSDRSQGDPLGWAGHPDVTPRSSE